MTLPVQKKTVIVYHFFSTLPSDQALVSFFTAFLNVKLFFANIFFCKCNVRFHCNCFSYFADGAVGLFL